MFGSCLMHSFKLAQRFFQQILVNQERRRIRVLTSNQSKPRTLTNEMNVASLFVKFVRC